MILILRHNVLRHHIFYYIAPKAMTAGHSIQCRSAVFVEADDNRDNLQVTTDRTSPGRSTAPIRAVIGSGNGRPSCIVSEHPDV